MNNKEYKLTKELLDEMRDTEGFPLGKDEDIIALSDPPYYTACPNPWVKDFIEEHGKPYNEETDDYHREPFAFDVTEGRNDPIYNAHPYHTKVPYKAIMRYILHYTDPGDIVFDGFCGTGMTGVAGQMCDDRRAIENLGYNVNPSGTIINKDNKVVSKAGIRYAILNELSPIASLITYHYNTPFDMKEFEKDAKSILAKVEKECSWMYETKHTIEGKPQFEQDIHGNRIPVVGRINFTVWSDVFVCPNCGGEIIFWNTAVDKIKKEVKSEFNCPQCSASVTKRNLDRAMETVYDNILEKTIKRAKQVPVLINYSLEKYIGKKKRFEKAPDEEDLALIDKIDKSKPPYWFPSNAVPKGYNTDQPKISHGVYNVHHFYTRRNLWVLAALWKYIRENKNRRCQFWFSSSLTWCGRENRLHLGNYFGRGGGVITSLRGTWYIASLSVETNVLERFRLRVRSSQYTGKFQPYNTIKEARSSTALFSYPAESIDYIFVDPPFGCNLMYSELNFVWESWFRVFTDKGPEAIINKIQRKGLTEYQHLMELCFHEFYRILKPGRWMTVEFHNSQNSVWMAIQEALQRAGFVVADVGTLDKKRGSFKQVTTTTAVKQDLIITAYKPNGGLEKRFKLASGTEEGVWEFVKEHLERLPKPIEKDGSLEVIAERQNFLLFDRMVAFHVQRGVIVPISAGDFYLGLRQRFPERDGMYFLPEQVVEYDRKRLTAKKVEQLSLTVHDEKSAVQWLRQELNENPQTFQEIQPKFLRNLHKDKYEKLPELLEVLEQSFLKDEKGRWYIPDPSKQSDLEKLREKALLKEFEKYKEGKGKLKEFRTEAVRAGFKKCWSERDYKTITVIAERLPPAILQEDSTLLMYYDNATTRGGDA
ncbi:MAG: DNA methylase [Theionarchaea archaeon]|nr:DNA methylase [Theionarchaea archaeon]